MADGTEQRRYPRFEAAVPCTLKLKDGPLQLVSVDVSRHGAFLRTDVPRPERELIRICFQTPIGDVEAMCMVVRAFSAAKPSAVGPGMGVDFFAIAKEAKDVWDAFVSDVKIRGHEHGASGRHTLVPDVLDLTDDDIVHDPPPEATSALLAAPLEEVAAKLPAAHPPARPRARFLMRLPDKQRLRDFLANVDEGGMFLRTPVLREVDDLVDVMLVHPESGEEFALGATVAKVVLNEANERRGLGLHFDPLTGARLQALVSFIETGVVIIGAQQYTGEHRLIELLRQAKGAPDSADMKLAMGLGRLERGDASGALSALTKALVLAPDRTEVHRALEHAYDVVGDRARSESHARVALALELQVAAAATRSAAG